MNELFHKIVLFFIFLRYENSKSKSLLKEKIFFLSFLLDYLDEKGWLNQWNTHRDIEFAEKTCLHFTWSQFAYALAMEMMVAWNDIRVLLHQPNQKDKCSIPMQNTQKQEWATFPKKKKHLWSSSCSSLTK